MNTTERLEKLQKDLAKLEEKEKKLVSQIRETKQEISVAEKKILAEKNESIVAMIEEKIGRVDEEKLQKLNRILEEQCGKFCLGLEEEREQDQEIFEEKFEENDCQDTGR